MPALKELRHERGQLEQQMRALVDGAEKENRDLTAEEDQQFKALFDQDKMLRSRIERQEQLDSHKRELDTPRRPREDRDRFPASAVGKVPDDGKAIPDDEARALALQAWCLRREGRPITKRHKAACRQTGVNPGAAKLELVLPDHRALAAAQMHFRTVHPTLAHQRALSAIQGTAGGFTVPQVFLNRFELAMLTHGPMLQEAEIIRTETGGEMPWPTSNDTGNEAEIVGENSCDTVGSDPVFTAVIFSAYKFKAGPILVPVELLEDSAFDLAEKLGEMLGERQGRGQNRKYTVGTGAGEPRGITLDSTLGVTAAGAAAITGDELIELQHSVDPAYRTNAAWMMHDNVVMAIRKLKDSDGQYLWQSGLQAGVPDRLLGHRVAINNHMASAIASGNKTVLFGQFDKYKVRQVRGRRTRRLTERYADCDQEGFVSFQRADGALLDAGTHPVKHILQP